MYKTYFERYCLECHIIISHTNHHTPLFVNKLYLVYKYSTSFGIRRTEKKIEDISILELL